MLVSSLGAAGPNEKANGLLSESDPCRPVSAYGRSKLKAEEIARTYTAQVPITIVRPSAVYGPRDTSILRQFQTAHRSGKILQVGPGPKSLSLAHVQDIANGIYQAGLSATSVNETYFLASEKPYSLEDIQVALEQCMGKRLRISRVPGIVVQGLMLYADVLSKCFGKDVLLNRDRLQTLSYPRWDCDISKAHRDFGYQPSHSLSDGLRETYDWYREQGWL
nr:NAD-dependent epimerase/dehydratase [uncultured bacterium]